MTILLATVDISGASMTFMREKRTKQRGRKGLLKMKRRIGTPCRTMTAVLSSSNMDMSNQNFF